MLEELPSTGMKKKNSKQVPNCIPEEMQIGDGFVFEDGTEGEIVSTEKAKYQGRDAQLNKPMAGDVKKSKVYVKNEKGMLSRLSLVIQT